MKLVIGDRELKPPPGMKMEWVFKKDHTFRLEAVAGDTTKTGKGKWSRDDNRLTLTDDSGKSETTDIELADDRLKLTLKKMTMVLKRKE